MQATTTTRIVIRNGQQVKQITTHYTPSQEDIEENLRRSRFYNQFHTKHNHNRWLRQSESLIEILQDPWKSEWPIWIKNNKAFKRKLQKRYQKESQKEI